MNLLTRIICAIPGLGLTIAGALCTAYVFYDMAPINTNLEWLNEGQFSGAVGILMDIAKIGLMMAAVYLFSSGRKKMGFLVGLASAILVSISMFATHEFISSDVNKGSEVASSEVVALQGVISNIDDEIASYREAIQKNIETADGYGDRYVSKSNEVIEKNIPLLSKISELNSQKNDRLLMLAEAQAKAVESTQVQKAFYIIIAVTFDFAGMLCWGLATWTPVRNAGEAKRVSRIKSEPVVDVENALESDFDDAPVPAPLADVQSDTSEPVDVIDHQEAHETDAREQERIEAYRQEVFRSAEERRQKASKTQEVEAVMEEQANEDDTDLTDDEKKVVQALESGEIQPKKAEIRVYMRVGDKKAQELMVSLLEKGKLIKEGRFYQLPSAS